MGHDLAAGLASAVALAGCRSTRRAGGTLSDIADRIDADLHRWRPGGLLTGVFAHLDLDTGRLAWINAGHPPPLLIRALHVVPTPAGEARRASRHGWRAPCRPPTPPCGSSRLSGPPARMPEPGRDKYHALGFGNPVSRVSAFRGGGRRPRPGTGR
ncbi:SpoIIE family protein phosphatase [Streptomyces sp. NPDC001123]